MVFVHTSDFIMLLVVSRSKGFSNVDRNGLIQLHFYCLNLWAASITIRRCNSERVSILWRPDDPRDLFAIYRP